jgi:hypothetical protein
MKEQGFKEFPRYKSITRLDYPHKHLFGWLVRVVYNGQMVRKYFMDREYNSPEAALEAALDFRNETERDLGKRRSERPVITQTSSQRPGIVGVHRTQRRTRSDRGNVRDVYEVTWTEPSGKIGRTCVSIRKYGEEGAFRRACEIRQAKERQYYTEPECA